MVPTGWLAVAFEVAVLLPLVSAGPQTCFHAGATPSPPTRSRCSDFDLTSSCDCCWNSSFRAYTTLVVLVSHKVETSPTAPRLWTRSARAPTSDCRRCGRLSLKSLLSFAEKRDTVSFFQQFNAARIVPGSAFREPRSPHNPPTSTPTIQTALDPGGLSASDWHAGALQCGIFTSSSQAQDPCPCGDQHHSRSRGPTLTSPLLTSSSMKTAVLRWSHNLSTRLFFNWFVSAEHPRLTSLFSAAAGSLSIFE